MCGYGGITLDHMREKTETEERRARPLIRLAKLAGVETSYVGQTDDYHEIDDDVLVAILGSLGIDASGEDSIERSIRMILDERHTRLVDPTILHTSGTRSSVYVNTGVLDVPEASITLENGEKFDEPLRVGPGDGAEAYSFGDSFVVRAAIIIPPDLPMGYHTLHVRVADKTQDATVICAPERIEPVEGMKSGRLWGWMAQLYSIRSAQSWGVGDFEDLKTMLVSAKRKTGADFVLLNPLHAAEAVPPLTPSPYLPISRDLVNFTYIRPENIEEYRESGDDVHGQVRALHEQVEALNGDPQLIDRDAMWRVKMHALWIIYKLDRSQVRRSQFEDFKGALGQALESYATWCLCYDKWGAPTSDEHTWERILHRESPEVAALRSQFPDTLDFYKWLEWIASEQLGDAQKAAKKAGMQIGIMSDMAVGVHPQGSDVWWAPEGFARNATVGAPPDYFNQQGQDWSQPPLNPIQLERTGYEAYRTMVRGMFAASGAVRIDHILGLFRLWWIPRGSQARQGAYVRYDSEIMLGILAIEATRSHGVVVGEDLGVVPDYVGESLRRHGVLGCCVEWFEQKDGVFRRPSEWREHALASVNTHDMPPAAGYLAYEHVKIRERLHLLTESAQDFQAQAVEEHNAMLAMLTEGKFLDPALLDDEHSNEWAVVEALYKALAASPSKLLGASLVDAVGEKRAQNQPGTNNEYPNWRVPLADGHGDVVPLEGLFDRPGVQSLAAIMRG
jgi:4-alpha-glucanotransferase